MSSTPHQVGNMTTGALVCWFTGLSGAGKTTIAELVSERLRSDGLRVGIFDGDDVRDRLHRELGFSEEDIKLNNALIAELCEEARRDHDVILVPIISPYAESRAKARSRLGAGFYEIYVEASVDTVARRDVKGLYAAARAGRIPNMIGYSPGAVYQAPTNPDLLLNTEADDVVRSAERLCAFITACRAGLENTD